MAGGVVVVVGRVVEVVVGGMVIVVVGVVLRGMGIGVVLGVAVGVVVVVGVMPGIATRWSTDPASSALPAVQQTAAMQRPDGKPSLS